MQVLCFRGIVLKVKSNQKTRKPSENTTPSQNPGGHVQVELIHCKVQGGPRFPWLSGVKNPSS